MVVVSLRARARAPAAPLRYNFLLLAIAITFPVIGLEQFWHTTPVVLRTLPLYEALHWISDSLLALPLATAAVWFGTLAATHFRVGSSSVSDVFTRACIIAIVFALLLVPGEALHQQADALTHTHAVLGFHSHVPTSPPSTQDPQLFVTQALHALSDAIEGQVLGLPIAFVALLWARRHLA